MACALLSAARTMLSPRSAALLQRLSVALWLATAACLAAAWTAGPTLAQPAPRTTYGRASLATRASSRRDPVKHAPLRRPDHASSQAHVRDNAFNTTRDLSAYTRIFGARLTARLRELQRTRGARGHWIDMGAGDANAIEEYLDQEGDGAIRTTALGYAEPAEWSTRGPALRARAPRMRGLFGRMLGDYRRGELGRADVITDLFGPASYSEQLDDVVFHYGELLRPGGEAHLALATTTIDGDDGSEAIRQWLASGSGFEVLPRASDVPARASDGTFSITLRRTSAPLVVPPLRLASFRPDMPPERAYVRPEPAQAHDAAALHAGPSPAAALPTQ